MAAEKTLYPDVEEPTEGNLDDKIVMDFFKVIREFEESNEDHLQTVKSLREQKDKVADTDDPTKSNKRTNSSMLHKLTYKTLKQLDLPSFSMFASEASEPKRSLVQSLLESALKEAGWRKVLTGKKHGAQKEAYTTGDSIIGCGSNPDGHFPFTFWNQNIFKVFANIDATELRNPGSEQEVRKWVIVKEYQYEQAISSMPDLKGKVSLGCLPYQQADSGENRQTDEQEALKEARKFQIAYCYDLDYEDPESGKKGLYCEIAGANGYKRKELVGDDYPFRNKYGDPELPYAHLIGFASEEGFFNQGIFQICYKLGEMHRVLTNMGITYTLSNSNPLRIVTTNKSEDEFAGDVARAQRDAKDGKVPILINRDGKDFGGVSTLASNPIINEVNMILQLIEKDLMQMGFNVNDISTNTSKTLGALQLEVAASSELIKYLQKENAPAYEELLGLFIQYLVDREVDDSDIPLAAKTIIRGKDGSQNEVTGVPEVDDMGQPIRDDMGRPKISRGFTLEDLKTELRRYEWTIEVSGGVVNNPVLEDAQLRDIIASAPGTKAAQQALAIRARKILNLNLQPEDFMPPQPEAAGQPAAQGTGQPVLNEQNAVPI